MLAKSLILSDLYLFVPCDNFDKIDKIYYHEGICLDLNNSDQFPIYLGVDQSFSFLTLTIKNELYAFHYCKNDKSAYEGLCFLSSCGIKTLKYMLVTNTRDIKNGFITPIVQYNYYDPYMI